MSVHETVHSAEVPDRKCFGCWSYDLYSIAYETTC